MHHGCVTYSKAFTRMEPVFAQSFAALRTRSLMATSLTAIIKMNVISRFSSTMSVGLIFSQHSTNDFAFPLSVPFVMTHPLSRLLPPLVLLPLRPLPRTSIRLQLSHMHQLASPLCVGSVVFVPVFPLSFPPPPPMVWGSAMLMSWISFS